MIKQLISGLGVALALTSASSFGAEQNAVDLALVLAVDVSTSIDEGEAGLQREGYVHAFRDQRVINAIKAGAVGRIAVTYVEWSSPFYQSVLIPWRTISDEKSANAFAKQLDSSPYQPDSTTSISGGIDFSVKLLKSAPVEAARKVIDVSGDGYSDVGRPVTVSRDDAVRAGITINGLPVMNQDPSKHAAPADLDLYYRDNVIGGPGAFYVVARNVDGFSEALVHKLVLEIAERRGMTEDRLLGH